MQQLCSLSTWRVFCTTVTQFEHVERTLSNSYIKVIGIENQSRTVAPKDILCDGYVI